MKLNIKIIRKKTLLIFLYKNDKILQFNGWIETLAGRFKKLKYFFLSILNTTWPEKLLGNTEEISFELMIRLSLWCLVKIDTSVRHQPIKLLLWMLGRGNRCRAKTRLLHCQLCLPYELKWKKNPLVLWWKVWVLKIYLTPLKSQLLWLWKGKINDKIRA